MRIVKNGDVHVSAPIGISKGVIEAFVNQHQDWIEQAGKKAAERRERQDAFFNRLQLDTRNQKKEAAEQAGQLILPKVKRNAEIMGVKPSAISFRPMTSRWGVCNVRTRSICFSTYLLLLPDWCVEHIVVHELCHLKEPRHNARFYSLMDRYYPSWREARKVTREIARGGDSSLGKNGESRIKIPPKMILVSAKTERVESLES